MSTLRDRVRSRWDPTEGYAAARVMSIHVPKLGCGLGFRVWGLGFRVWGLGFRVWGSGFRV